MLAIFKQAFAALLHGARLRPWRWLVVCYLLLSTATRCTLLLKAGHAADPTLWTITLSLLIGACWDIIAASCLFLPLVVILAALPARWRNARVGRLFLYGGMAAWIVLLLFIAVAEWIFWGEFQTRFNFIAVDYLVYTHEVLANIWQSYPVAEILACLAGLSLVFVWWQRRPIAGGTVSFRWQAELLAALSVAIVPFAARPLVNTAVRPFLTNHYANEISRNGVIEFLRAFNLAELDYNSFYPKLRRRAAYARVRHLGSASVHQHFADHDPYLLTRETYFRDPLRALNVVLISVESLSAEFLGHFGNREGLTPNLDRLAHESLMFANLYATGTRTVRGLEALTLSIPPTPGESIIKRPRNTGLVTLGGILREHGYDVRFVYGGYARFDNMAAFFGGNGYQVVDRTDIPDQRIHYENAWGVADEDLFTQALLEIGRSAAAKRPSFTHIMTTSNHRPFTYPNGRIDLPSGLSGRAGGVKYTDWAIGDFIARAKGEAWFKDTIFVIVADHCASSAGKTTLPPERYRIPLLIYAPSIVAPSDSDQLASQIDVAPTVLGLLRMPYRAAFFGRDLLDPMTQSPYAFISTYQELGFLRDGRLVELAPNATPVVFSVAAHQAKLGPEETLAFTRDGIAMYQVAADAFRRGALRHANVELPLPSLAAMTRR